MDIFSKRKRSEVMSKIHGKNTSFERGVFSYLRRQSVYCQKHHKRTLGTPDLAVPSKKIAVFLDSAFWHGRDYKSLKPRLSNFWRTKIEANIRRDKNNTKRLRKMGWRVLRVWDFQLRKHPEIWLSKIAEFLKRGGD